MLSIRCERERIEVVIQVAMGGLTVECIHRGKVLVVRRYCGRVAVVEGVLAELRFGHHRAQ